MYQINKKKVCGLLVHVIRGRLYIKKHDRHYLRLFPHKALRLFPQLHAPGLYHYPIFLLCWWADQIHQQQSPARSRFATPAFHGFDLCTWFGYAAFRSLSRLFPRSFSKHGFLATLLPRGKNKCPLFHVKVARADHVSLLGGVYLIWFSH